MSKLWAAYENLSMSVSAVHSRVVAAGGCRPSNARRVLQSAKSDLAKVDRSLEKFRAALRSELRTPAGRRARV